MQHRNQLVVVLLIMNSTQASVAGKKRGDLQSEAAISPEELLSAEETAKLLRLERQTLAAWRSKGLGPQYVKVGRSCYYQRSAISTWLAGQVVKPGTAA